MGSKPNYREINKEVSVRLDIPKEYHSGLRKLAAHHDMTMAQYVKDLVVKTVKDALDDGTIR